VTAGGPGALPTLIWLLEEGGANITDRDREGYSALLLSAMCGKLTTCKWLLEHGGADITDRTNAGKDVWHKLGNLSYVNAAELTALLRVMVLWSAPPGWLVRQMSPEHAPVGEEGVRLKAALPAYLARRRALLDVHCPLIAPLRALVCGYDEPTTTEELWATGLGVAPRLPPQIPRKRPPKRARRPRVEVGAVLPVRRSARLRQRLE
jgi:hypothetical protein